MNYHNGTRMVGHGPRARGRAERIRGRVVAKARSDPSVARRELGCVRIFLVGLLLFVSGCSTNPATGRSQMNVLSTQQEISLGAQAAPDFVKELGGEIPSAAIRQYVSDIGGRLASSSERADLPWEFKVVDSAVLNAFALPGGKVFISRGLLVKLSDEAMLAGVLGHEIGHTTAKHIGEQMTRQMVLSGVISGATRGNSEWLAVLGAGAKMGGGLYLLEFSRDNELESDHLGIRYITRQGYDPRGMVRVLKVLEAAAAGAPRASMFSTHPAPAARAKRAARYIGRKFPDVDEPGKYTVNAEQFQQVVLANLAALPPAKHTGQ